MSEASVKVDSGKHHEGNELRKIIRRSGLTQEAFAENLGMTTQNLNYHMRKNKLNGDFVRLLKEKGIHLFSEIENKPEKVENESLEGVPYNILLEKKRLATVILPRESKGSDIDTIIAHLKLMKDSLD